VKILTVDTRSRRIEAQLKDSGIIQIALYEVPGGFRWPVEAEWWIVVRENGDWFLRAPRQDPEASLKIEDLEPGDSLSGVPGATHYFAGDLSVEGNVIVGGTFTLDGTLEVDLASTDLTDSADLVRNADIAFDSPNTLIPGAANAEGSAITFARSDHMHDLPTADAEAITGTNDEGVSENFARSDHDHAYGAGSVTDAALASPNNLAEREIYHAECLVDGGTTATVWCIGKDQLVLPTVTLSHVAAFWYDPADHDNVPGKTCTWRLRCFYVSNATAYGATMGGIGLARLTPNGGGVGVVTSAIAGEGSLGVSPGAPTNSTPWLVTGTVAATPPASAMWLCLYYWQSAGTTAANHRGIVGGTITEYYA
jgi:hypothetical protein